ncbi:MAG: alpha-hydroxy acid oxidase [Burkholderiaceae bacterium]|nr:alpha-hydroxy acid oxidase [Burkholderiaceae bacterium]
MATVPQVATMPDGIVTLADHEAHARTRLDDNAWAYFSGGAGDEITLRGNRRAWDGLQLHPRILLPLAGGHTRTRLLGKTLAHPIMLAPVAYQRMAHPDGELATAHAAAALGAGMVLSTQSSVALESVAQAVLNESNQTSRGPLWFQLYMLHDRGFTTELVRRAEQAGFEALVVTVDAPASGYRDRERRANFRLPVGVSAVNLAGLSPQATATLQTGQSALFDGLLVNVPTWADIAWLQSITRLPILLKGVLHEADARQAADMGLAGVIVSNHGGRTLDTAPATAHVLPRIVQALAGELPVLVDGGIRRGTDVFKALALGASAVLVGRPVVYGLTNAGAVGVAHVLRLLRDELEIAMALCGCKTPAQITVDHLFTPS